MDRDADFFIFSYSGRPGSQEKHQTIFRREREKYIILKYTFLESAILDFIHCKKKVIDFPPSPTRMPQTKLSLAGNNLNYSRPGRFLLVTSRLRTGKSLTFFYSVGLGPDLKYGSKSSGPIESATYPVRKTGIKFFVKPKTKNDAIISNSVALHRLPVCCELGKHVHAVEARSGRGGHLEAAREKRFQRGGNSLSASGQAGGSECS